MTRPRCGAASSEVSGWYPFWERWIQRVLPYMRGEEYDNEDDEDGEVDEADEW